MSNAKHAGLRTIDIHPPIRWEFPNATARAATTDPNTGAPYLASDISNFALQTDDNSIWMLTDTTPTWIGVSVNSSVFGLTAGRIVFVGTDGSLTDDAGLVWDNTNKRVGVGITSPTAKVDINTSGEQLRLRASLATGNPFLTFYQDTTRRSYIQLHNTDYNLKFASEYGVITFHTDSGGAELERMRINSSGQILIGTTTPVGTEKLNVAGDIVVSDGAGKAESYLSAKDASVGRYYFSGEDLPSVPSGSTLRVDIIQTNTLHWNQYYNIAVDLIIQQENSTSGFSLAEKLIMWGKDNATPTLRQTVYSSNYQYNVTYTRTLITGGIRYEVTNNSSYTFNAYANNKISVNIESPFAEYFNIIVSVV